MLLRNLNKVWIAEYEAINNHGEKSKKWSPKKDVLTVKEVNKTTVQKINELEIKKLSIKANDGIAWLNIQQDINELDRKPTGEVDYRIEKARSTIDYKIQKGNGISITDITDKDNFKPDYIVTDKIKIGNTILYKMEKNNGDSF